MEIKKKIALIDDCQHFYSYLKNRFALEFGSHCSIIYFSDSDSFIDYLMNNSHLDLELVLVDRFIKSYDLFSDDFVETCKQLGCKSKIVLLSTDPPATQDQKSEEGKFDWMIRKGTTSMMKKLRDIVSK